MTSTTLSSIPPTVILGPGADPVFAELPDDLRIGRYEAKAVLGRGGMGVVLEAYDPELDRRIALKLVRPRSGGWDTQGRSEALREARALALLAHPHVVTVFDAGELMGFVFIAMELVQGRTLRDWQKQRPTPAEALRVFLQAGEGLAAAHRAGVVHRDVKPDNILIGDDGRVRVVDFGIASAPSGAGVEASAAPVAGTPGYMAPEQEKGLAADARSDQFALCVALYEALFGERPFAGSTAAERLRAVELGLPARRRPRGVPARWIAALRRGLAADPADRFPTVDALLAALRRDPLRTARRWAPVALSGVLLMAAAVRAASTDAPCNGAPAALAGAWDNAAAASVERALLATGVPFAADAARGVRAALDGYARAWAAEHTDACLATRVRKTQTEEVLALRMECLEQRRQSLLSAAAILRGADADLMPRATRVARELPDLAACRDTAALRSAVRAPAGPIAGRVEAARGHLARAQALAVAGRYDAARAEVDTIVAEAEDLAFAPLLAPALLLRSRLLRSQGAFAEAKVVARDAALRALEARDDELMAHAFIEQVSVAGDGLGDDAAAQEWGRFARAALARRDDPPVPRADLERALGASAYRVGRFADAAAHDAEALQLLERAPARDDLAISAVHNNLCIAASDRGQHDEAVAHCRTSLDLTRELLGADHPETAQTLSNLGRALMMAGRAAEAEGLVRESIAVRRRNGAGKTLGTAMALVNLSATLLALGRAPEAERAARESDALYVELGSDKRAFALTNLGDALRLQGRHGDARAAYAEAEALWRTTLGPAYPPRMEAVRGLGQSLHAEGRLDEAAAHLREALTLAEAQLGREHGDVIALRQELGEVIAAPRPGAPHRRPSPSAMVKGP